MPPTRARLLLETEIRRQAGRIRASAIATTRVETAQPGERVAVVLERAAGFDHVPVVESGKLIGLLHRHSAPPAALVRDAMSRVARADRIRRAESIEGLLQKLSGREAVLVSERQTVALVHFSDLNRQPVRVFLYLWLSALEMALADLIAALPMEQWLPLLPPKRRKSVVERLAQMRKDDVVIDLVEALDLADLLKLFPKMPGQLRRLGVSRSRFEHQTRHLFELRHKAMHPVRMLVHKHEDVARLRADLADLQELTRRSCAVQSA